jgi:hypothetical protein
MARSDPQKLPLSPSKPRGKDRGVEIGKLLNSTPRGPARSLLVREPHDLEPAVSGERVALLRQRAADVAEHL